MQTLRLLALVLACLFVAALAHAEPQTAPASPPTQAEQSFRDGRAAADALDFKTALAKFTESERLEPAPGTLLNIADCEEHLGKLVSAREHFDLAASGFRRDDARRALAASRAAQLEKRLAHLTMRLALSVPADATILKGGLPVDRASLGQPVLVDPGTVTIVVNAPNRAHRTYNLELREGQSLEATLDVGELASDVTPNPGPTSVETSPGSPSKAQPPIRRTIGFVVGGVGLAGLVAGGVFGVLALSQASTVKNHCDPNYSCDSQGVDAASSGKAFALTSTISLIAGGVLLGAGAYLVLSSRPRRSASDARPRWGEGPMVVLVPYATPYGGGATTAMAF